MSTCKEANTQLDNAKSKIDAGVMQYAASAKQYFDGSCPSYKTTQQACIDGYKSLLYGQNQITAGVNQYNSRVQEYNDSRCVTKRQLYNAVNFTHL